ncbi:MAG: DUF4399 domain-containing protein [Myxococcota bacterium]
MRYAMIVVAGLVGCGSTEAPKVEEKKIEAPVAAPPVAPVEAPVAAPPVAPVVPPPAGAKVMFLEPANGAKVKSPVKLKFGVEGMTVKEAGDLTAGTGHHHVIVDKVGIEAGQMVPKDETHIHYGKGQTEAEIPLTPGEYDLTLQFADGNHMSFGPQMASTIHVTVE